MASKSVQKPSGYLLFLDTPISKVTHIGDVTFQREDSVTHTKKNGYPSRLLVTVTNQLRIIERDAMERKHQFRDVIIIIAKETGE